MPVRSTQSKTKGAAGAKGKATRSPKKDSKASKVTVAGKAKKDIPSKTKAKANDGEVIKLQEKLIMVDNAIIDKKNQVHAIAAAQLDDDVVIEENGWKFEKKEYEEQRLKLIDEVKDKDDMDPKTAQSIQRLERKKVRNEKAHEDRLGKLKLELAEKRDNSEKEAKRLNQEIEGLRKFHKKVVAELEAAKKALE